MVANIKETKLTVLFAHNFQLQYILKTYTNNYRKLDVPLTIMRRNVLWMLQNGTNKGQGGQRGQTQPPSPPVLMAYSAPSYRDNICGGQGTRLQA